MRDEDEWSDDDPDPLLPHQPHIYTNEMTTRYSNEDVDEEDSLGGGRGGGLASGNEYGSLDDEMELALFGELQRSGGIKKHVPNVQTHGEVVFPHQQVQMNPSAVRPVYVSPTGGTAVNKGNSAIRTGGSKRVGSSGVHKANGENDDAASDCSDLTADSIRNTKPRSGATSRYNGSAVKSANTKNTITPAPPNHSASKQTRPNSKGVYVSGEVAPRVQVPLPVGFQQAPVFNYAQQQAHQQQQQVQFASNFMMTPLPAEIERSSGNNNNSSGTPSPSRSKGKPVYKKLKPIPISQPYHPVHNPL